MTAINMTAIKLSFVMMLFTLVLPAFGAAYQESLPTQTAPDGLKTFDVNDGGRILFGKSGDNSSGAAAFKSGLRRTKGYFDTSLNLLSVVNSKGGEVTMGTFTATLRGANVGGLAISMYDPNGLSRFALLLLSHSLLDPSGSLYKMQAQMARRSSNAPPTIPGQIVITYDSDPASAWKKFLAENARQQNIPYPDPQISKQEPMHMQMPGWSGCLISGKMTVHGEPFVFKGRLLVSPPPSPQGSWMLQTTILAAPVAHASADMPALIAMEKSEKVDMKATRELTMRNIAMINSQSAHLMAARQTAYNVGSQQRFNSSMARARASRDAMDKSTAGFIHYINGTTVVQHTPSGGHATVEANLAGALEKSDPQHFRVVPLKQYVKGVDY